VTTKQQRVQVPSWVLPEADQGTMIERSGLQVRDIRHAGRADIPSIARAPKLDAAHGAVVTLYVAGLP